MERPRWINYLKTASVGLPKEEKKKCTHLFLISIFSQTSKGLFFFPDG